MVLWRAEINYLILEQTRIAPTIQLLKEYCKAYQDDFKPLENLIPFIDHIITKWTNFVMNLV